MNGRRSKQVRRAALQVATEAGRPGEAKSLARKMRRKWPLFREQFVAKR